MQDILRKLALSMIAAQLKDPATKASLYAYVNSQVDGFVGSEAEKLTGAANPFLKVLGATLQSEAVKTELNVLIDEEFDSLLALVLQRLGLPA